MLMVCGNAAARLVLAGLFSDHMVMQRGVPVPVWGWAEAGERISVSIDAQTRSATADASGKWMVRLEPMEAGAPRKMTVKSGSQTLEISDVALGEVWLASGQSNMAWPLKQALNGRDEVAAARYPDIRFFRARNNPAPKAPQDRLPAWTAQSRNVNSWLATSPETAGDFSAVAYFFARELREATKVPVGIVWNPVDGSPIEAWISRDGYAADPDFKAVADYYDGLANYVENTPAGRQEVAELSARYDAKQAQLRASGKPQMWPIQYQGPLQAASFASTLYNSLTHPLIPYAVRGVLWYQGEAQFDRMYEYRGSLPLLIKDWRRQWGQADLPFVYVQLPNWSKPSAEPEAGGWALIREAQLHALKMPRTAMAVTIDIGNAADVHPQNKQDVGHRLAMAARGLVYGEPVVASGPLYRSQSIEGSRIRLAFDSVGKGLMVGRKRGLEPVAEDAGTPLRQFAIAGSDGKFVWADAVIDKDTVVVSSPAVPKPVAVRYAWAYNPEGCNLYNRDGLPASPFRTDAPASAPPLGAFFKAKLQKGFSLQSGQ
jgi:sialate O-acetylesterase